MKMRLENLKIQFLHIIYKGPALGPLTKWSIQNIFVFCAKAMTPQRKKNENVLKSYFKKYSNYIYIHTYEIV